MSSGSIASLRHPTRVVMSVVRPLVWGLLLTLIALCALHPRAARADDSPYQLHAAADATVIGLSAVTWWGPTLFRSTFVRADRCPCALSSINGLDREVAGIYHPTLSLAGDIALGGLYSLAVILDLFDVAKSDQPVASFLTDLAVMAETLLINGAVNELAKISVARPRPLAYTRSTGDPLLHDPENYVSFYSAHTSSAFALGLAYAQTFAYRHPNNPLRFVVYAAAIAVGSGIGLTRIAAGKHFPSDVLTGAAAGTAVGLLIPWLHRRDPRARIVMQLAPGTLGMSFSFTNL